MIKANSKKKEEIYETYLAKILVAKNKGVKIHCIAVTAQVFTIVGLVVELNTSIGKTNGYIDSYPSID